VALRFLPRSKLLVVGDMGGNVELWDTQTGVLKWVVSWTHAKAGSIFSLAVSPDGKLLACASVYSMVQLRDAQTGRLVRTLTGFRKSVTAVAFSPDGQTLATGCGEPLMRGMSTGNPQRLKSIENASSDNTVRLWDVRTWQVRQTLTGHNGNITSLAYSPDGKLLASGSIDSTIKLWDAKSGQLTRTLAGHKSGVWSIDFAPDGGTLVSGSYDNTVRLWRIR
jgi:WD40 repeat protein